jgi:hypothetical protein
MFDLRAIRKSLPSGDAGRGDAGRRGKTHGGKRRSALRVAVAAEALHRQEEDDLVAALSRSAVLRTQRVLMAREATTASIMLSPEHLPLPVGARVHFHLVSERIAPRESRSSLVVASVGAVAKRTDRPLVVTSRADPRGGSCEVVVLNSGDDAILNAFSIRFTVFRTTPTTDPASLSDEAACTGAWVLRDGVRWYGCASCRRRKPQGAFSQQNPANGRRNYRETMRCDDCVGSSQPVQPFESTGISALATSRGTTRSQTQQRQPQRQPQPQQSEQDLEAVEIANLFGGESLQ